MESRWKGKNLCFLGDSITEGVGVVPGERYFDYLGKDWDCNVYGFGVSGAQFFGLYEQALKMHSEHGENVDAIFVFAGTNDYCSGVPLGEWYTYSREEVVILKNNDGTPQKKEMRTVRKFSFDETTLKGNINRLMMFLKTNYADKEIFIMTPVHRAFSEFAPDNIQYDEMYSNSVGSFFDEYVNAVKEAAGIWAVELIDLYSVSGLFPLSDKSAALYFTDKNTDRLHPGKNGHIRMAETIKRKV